MALITESESLHDGLEFLSSGEILRGINQEDHKVAVATEAAIPALEVLVESILPRMKAGALKRTSRRYSQLYIHK